jgi:hypothetical protein
MTLVWIIAAAGALVTFATIIHSERAHNAAVREDRARFQARVSSYERRA